MPKYTAVLTEYHRVSSIYTDEFNTSDKAKWEHLKSLVEHQMDADEFEALPVKPPKDPKVWFQLYQQLSEAEYQDQKDDWITLRKGGCETSHELLDSKGKVIDSL